MNYYCNKVFQTNKQKQSHQIVKQYLVINTLLLFPTVNIFRNASNYTVHTHYLRVTNEFSVFIKNIQQS